MLPLITERINCAISTPTVIMAATNMKSNKVSRWRRLTNNAGNNITDSMYVERYIMFDINDNGWGFCKKVTEYDNIIRPIITTIGVRRNGMRRWRSPRSTRI